MTDVELKLKKKYSLGNRIKESWVSYLMLAPFALAFITLVLIPILAAIVLSFTNFNMIQFPGFVGFANYARMILADDVFLIAVKNTLLFAVITGPVGYIMSFMFAWLINELGKKTRSVLTLIFYLPSLAGNVYAVWTLIFSNDAYGWINGFLIQYGIITEPIMWLTDVRTNVWVCMIVIVWMSMGAGFLAFVAGFQALNPELKEAAAIDGIRNRWQELWYVTLPQMQPMLLFGAVNSISAAFSVGYQNSALTGFPSTDYSTHTVVLHIMDFGSIRFEMGYASAIAVVLFLALVVVWKYTQKLLSRFSPD